MAHKFESGDEFRFDPKYLSQRRCRAKDKTYIIDHISKYGNIVYYIDNRTNIKCKCIQCRQGKPNRWGPYPTPDPNKDPNLKSTHIELIILSQPKLQRTRDISLKVLFGKEKVESDTLTLKEFREKHSKEFSRMKESEIIYNWNLYLEDPDNFKLFKITKN